jgi:hypothetical protein
MARYDLNGDPLPENNPTAAAPPGPAPQQFDLSGNSLPAPTAGPPSAGSYPPPGAPRSAAYAPPGPPPPGNYPPPGAPGPSGYGPPGAPGAPPMGNYPPPGGAPIPPPHYTAPRPPSRSRATKFENGRFSFVDDRDTSTSQQKLTRALLGMGLALGVGIPGCIGVMKLLLSINTGPAKLFILAYAAIGAVIGYGSRVAVGNGGLTAVGISAGITAVCLLIGHISFAAMAELPFGEAMGSFNGIHWLIIAASLVVAVRVAAVDSNDHGT